jgi:hypothetical protein
MDTFWNWAPTGAAVVAWGIALLLLVAYLQGKI